MLMQTPDNPMLEVLMLPMPETVIGKQVWVSEDAGIAPPVPVKVWDLINKVEKIHDVSSSSFFIILEP